MLTTLVYKDCSLLRYWDYRTLLNTVSALNVSSHSRWNSITVRTMIILFSRRHKRRIRWCNCFVLDSFHIRVQIRADVRCLNVVDPVRRQGSCVRIHYWVSLSTSTISTAAACRLVQLTNSPLCYTVIVMTSLLPAINL